MVELDIGQFDVLVATHQVRELRQLDGDIDKALDRRAESELDNNTYGLSSRTQELAARFNARHPTVSTGLRELGNILSNMGI